MAPPRLLKFLVVFTLLLGLAALATPTASISRWVVRAQSADSSIAQAPHGANQPEAVTDLGITISIRTNSPTYFGTPTTFSAIIANQPDRYTYNWSFGDGSTAFGAQVQHTYANLGDYRAFVIITNGSGSQKVDVSVKIIPPPDTPAPPPPSGLFCSADSPQQAGNPMTFVASVATGRFDSFRWEFGDGATSSGSTTSHTYLEPQEYTVTCFATAGNRTESYRFKVNVRDVPISGLNFKHSIPAYIGETVYFTAEIATGTRPLYEWTFGDGSPVTTGEYTTHIYTGGGIKEVSLQASNSLSAQRITKQSEVLPKPPSNLRILHDGPKGPGQTVTFNAIVDSDVDVTYAWNFGVGLGLYRPDSQTRNTFTQAKRYVVSCIAKNAAGTIRHAFIFYSGVKSSNQELSISVEPAVIAHSFPVSFTVSPIEEGAKYRWDFGDGNTQYGTTVTHVYKARDLYAVSVTRELASSTEIHDGDRIADVGEGFFLPIAFVNSDVQPTPGPTPRQTLTPEPTATNTDTPAPTATPTNTATNVPVPPSATSTPTPTFTNTATATSTATLFPTVPTATDTVVPPTITPTPTNTPEFSGTIPKPPSN